MSEYQYYEFRAIDRALTETQIDEISSLSSRASVTSRQASFVYHYGDFCGNEDELMDECFDIMLYMSNWGARHLIFRIPCSLIMMKYIAPFCITEEIDHRYSEDSKHVILNLNFSDEDQTEWTEGEGWLDDLVNLREEIIQGDYRVLYLAWLKAANNGLLSGEIDGDTLEPPVPNGLKELSNAQKVYVRFLDIDKTMINVAAQQSNDLQQDEIQAEQWIGKLSEKDKNDFLHRLSRGENNLSALLNRHLHELSSKERPQEKKNVTSKRTISSLIYLAEK